MAEARTLVKLLAALLALCIPTLASATEYHVTPLTFGKPSLMALRPGDILWLGSGTYAGGLEAYSLPAGTADAPITVKAEVQGLAIIDGGSPRGWSLAGCSYWVLDGLVFTHAQGAGLYLGPSSHAMVRNCVMRANGYHGMLTGHATYLTVDSCEMFGSIEQHGLYLSGASSHSVVRNSSFYRNRMAGIQCNNQGETTPFTDVLIENCRFWSNGGAGVNGGDAKAAAVNLLVVSNVTVRSCDLHDNWANGVTFNTCTNCVVEGSAITFKGGTGWRCISSNVNTSITNVVRNSLLMMGQPKPAVDGVITQSNNSVVAMPVPIDAGGTATPGS